MGPARSNSFCGVLTVIFYFPHFFYIYHLEFFCQEELSLVSIARCIQLSMSVWTQILTLFFELPSNPIAVWFAAQVVLLGAPSSQLFIRHTSDVPIILLLAFPSSPAPLGALGSSWIFPA